ncbi:hypothetical protein Hanom_Chr03g00207411 [Helianthus anomalus]
MKMVFRGKKEVPTETIQTSHSENWYQVLKDVPLIALPEKALVGAAMSLCWRMNREDKPVYMEGDKERVGRWLLLPKILMRSSGIIILPGILKKRAPTAVTAPKKNDADIAQFSKTKNVRGETKGMRHSPDSWCDYVVVSDSLEGLAPAVVKRPKSEPRDTADIPPSNPNDPIDLESSPEHLLRKKV